MDQVEALDLLELVTYLPDTEEVADQVTMVVPEVEMEDL